jgi:selenocysteine lyase/cysteine desulfurase
VVADKPGAAAPDLIERLRRHRIVLAERLGRLRFSPHIYNSPAQLDEVVSVLSREESP